MGFKLNLHFLLAFVLSVVSSLKHDQSHDFDLLIFTQSRPQIVCHEWQEKNPSHTCNLPKDGAGGWSIHGIWPTKFHEGSLNFCNETWHFDPELIKPIEAELAQGWINVHKETSTYSFWIHEWRKHGTCATGLPQLNDKSKYFSQALQWLEQYSMTKVLNSAGIRPSMDTEYKLNDVYDAIKMYIGKNPALKCKKEANFNIITEIKICFDRNLKLHDCDGIVKSNHGHEHSLIECDINQRILYTDVLPKKLNKKKTPLTWSARLGPSWSHIQKIIQVPARH